MLTTLIVYLVIVLTLIKILSMQKIHITENTS
jgi:hypothetical protein